MDDVDRGHNENGFGQASYFGALPLPLCILLTDSGRGGVPLIFQILIDILTWQNLNGAFRLFNWPTNFNNILICVLSTHQDTFPDAYFQLFVQDSIPLKTHQGL